MTDGEAFLLVLVLIYLSDCLVWLPPSGYAIISFWSRRHVVRRAAVQFSALRKGFAVVQPLPFFGSVFVGGTWPVSLTPEGLSPLSRENPNPGSALGAAAGAAFLRWEEIETIRAEGSRIRVNRKPYADCASAWAARRLAGALETVRLAPPAAREEAIARLARRSLDDRRVKHRSRFFLAATAPLRLSVSALFVAVFFLVPFAYWRLHDEPRFFLVLGIVWILMWRVALQFWRLHRRFYPGLSADRWQHAILSILFPHHAIRSLDVLSKEFLSESHPVAIAASLARPEEFQRLAEFVDRDIRHPIPLADPDGKAETAAETFHSQYFRPAFEAFLIRTAFPIAPDTAIGARPSPECPRCGTRFVSAGVPCEDCGGLLTVIRPRRGLPPADA